MTPCTVGVMTPTESVANREDLSIADCTCVFSCEDDPETACSLSGTFHTHQDLGSCPVHPEADKS